MPIGDKIYEVLSKKHGQRLKRMEELPLSVVNLPPPSVDNYKMNIPNVSKSSPSSLANVAKEERLISPTEGMPAVNGESGQAIVDKYVVPVVSKIETLNPEDAAINLTPEVKKKKGGRPKKTKDE